MPLARELTFYPVPIAQDNFVERRPSHRVSRGHREREREKKSAEGSRSLPSVINKDDRADFQQSSSSCRPFFIHRVPYNRPKRLIRKFFAKSSTPLKFSNDQVIRKSCHLEYLLYLFYLAIIKGKGGNFFTKSASDNQIIFLSLSIYRSPLKSCKINE